MSKLLLFHKGHKIIFALLYQQHTDEIEQSQEIAKKEKGWFLSHLLIAGCDIGVQISVRPSVRSFVRPSVRSFVRPSTFTSKFSFLDIRDSCESETLHSNCP